jgi:hypothetical protein
MTCSLNREYSHACVGEKPTFNAGRVASAIPAPGLRDLIRDLIRPESQHPSPVGPLLRGRVLWFVTRRDANNVPEGSTRHTYKRTNNCTAERRTHVAVAAIKHRISCCENNCCRPNCANNAVQLQLASHVSISTSILWETCSDYHETLLYRIPVTISCLTIAGCIISERHSALPMSALMGGEEEEEEAG